MAQKLSYERYCWFHSQVQVGHFPNARTLAERFEISPKQAQRDIDFMRDRLGAPILFRPQCRGYMYTDSSYELPPVWLNQEELLALCLALRLSASIPDKKLKGLLHELIEKVLHFRSSSIPPSFAEMEEKVSLKNIEYYRVDEAIFHQALGALFQARAVRITYHTPYTGEETQRTIVPLHLLCYMGNWHLIAFCTLKGELRDFALSRIRTIMFEDEKVALPPDIPPVKEYLRKSFGVIAGDGSVEVVLKFTPAVSSWVSEQIWHDSQEITTNADGSLQLRFPVSGFKEVAREILKYGANVEVVSPDELRREIAEEIEKMARVYVQGLKSKVQGPRSERTRGVRDGENRTI